jgi:hypothetical protein
MINRQLAKDIIIQYNKKNSPLQCHWGALNHEVASLNTITLAICNGQRFVHHCFDKRCSVNVQTYGIFLEKQASL